ncbi:MAG: ATP-binding protein [Oscillospiraceae bacterium]
MGYDGTILRRANGRLDAQKEEKQRREALLRDEVYKKIPRIAAIDLALRETVTRAIAAALSHGTDTAEAVEKQRRENLKLQEERTALLVAARYDPAALSGAPLCPDCGDSGWNDGKMCHCLRDLCAQEQTRELSKTLDMESQSFSGFDLMLYPTAVGENGRSPREAMTRVLASCKDYAEQFPNVKPQNLYLYGGTGLGKTFLSAAIAGVVVRRGFSVVYDAAANIFAQFELQKFSRDLGDSQDAKDETRRYLNCDLLIIDDLGSEFTTPFVQSALYTIINTRLVKNKCTVISSNLSMPESERRYTPQVASRLKGEYRGLPFVGDDIRLLKK